MSVRFNGTATSYYTSATNVPASSSCTLCVFSKLRVDNNNFSSFLEWQTSTPGFGWLVTTDADGTTAQAYFKLGQVNMTPKDTDMNVWHFYAITMGGINTSGAWCCRAGNQQPAREGSNPGGTTFVGGPPYVGGASGGGLSINGDVAGVKLYNHALLGHEILAESRSVYPVKKAGLVAAWPMDAATTIIRDISSYKHDLTSNDASPVVEGGPPVARFPKPRGILANVHMFTPPVDPGPQTGNAMFFGTDF